MIQKGYKNNDVYKFANLQKLVRKHTTKQQNISHWTIDTNENNYPKM